MPRNIHIIGLFNTGTNLLFNIINNCTTVDLTDNTNITINNQHKPFFKHSFNFSIIRKYLNNPNNLLIIMYKNVYNWLYSIKKACYDINYSKLYLPVELYGKHFHNMIELYNFYYINYLSVLNTYSNAIFLDYEKVIDINNSYDYLNNKLSKFNICISSQTKFNSTLMSKAKTHGKSVNNAIEAKNKYDSINATVKQFVEKIPKLNNSIKPILISFYENA
jgi:hypothetical protein